MFVPFLIAAVRHRRFAHRVNSQHRLNSCSDIRRVRWNLCLNESMGIPRGCYILACLESHWRQRDFESSQVGLRVVPLAALKAASRVSLPAVSRAALKAVLQVAWTVSQRRAAVRTGELTAASKASPLHCCSSNCSHC
jgi:hypothetical protein